MTTKHHMLVDYLNHKVNKNLLLLKLNNNIIKILNLYNNLSNSKLTQLSYKINLNLENIKKNLIKFIKMLKY
jgi:hypothetical protein